MQSEIVSEQLDLGHFDMHKDLQTCTTIMPHYNTKNKHALQLCQLLRATHYNTKKETYRQRVIEKLNPRNFGDFLFYLERRGGRFNHLLSKIRGTFKIFFDTWSVRQI